MKYAAAAAAVFAGDFFLKQYVEAKKEWDKEILNGRIRLRRCKNRGAALNFMEKRPGLVKILCAAIFVPLGIFWLIMIRQKERAGFLWGLSFLVGGGASNLYDRVCKGYVVDYFSFQTPFSRLNQVIFNVSDLAIFLGAALTVLIGRRSS